MNEWDNATLVDDGVLQQAVESTPDIINAETAEQAGGTHTRRRCGWPTGGGEG